MERLKGKRILVTGGTGFVGSHVVELLLRQKAHIVVPTRSTDPRSYFMTQGLHKRVILVSSDITDTTKVKDIVTKYEIQSIIHLAAQPIVTTSFINPEETIRTNILGTLSVLDVSRTIHTVKQLIVASSDKAYGKSNSEYTEDMPLLGDHPYEVSKAAADLLSQAYVHTYNVPVIITRFGNIYGPGDLHNSRIVPGIMQAILTKQPLTLRSDGTFIRDYVYVKDVALAYLFLLQKFDTLPKLAYNIGSNDSLSVLNFIKKSQRVLKKSFVYRIENSQKNEIPKQHLNWGKIAAHGWKPAYTLSQGLKETYSWYKKNQKVLFYG